MEKKLILGESRNPLPRFWVQREQISQKAGFLLLHSQKLKALKSGGFPTFFGSKAVCFVFLLVAKIAVNQKCKQT